MPSRTFTRRLVVDQMIWAIVFSYYWNWLQKDLKNWSPNKFQYIANCTTCCTTTVLLRLLTRLSKKLLTKQQRRIYWSITGAKMATNFPNLLHSCVKCSCYLWYVLCIWFDVRIQIFAHTLLLVLNSWNVMHKQWGSLWSNKKWLNHHICMKIASSWISA